LLTLAMVLAAATSCNGKKSKSLDTVNYTYRSVWSKGPLNWNPHAWETSGDRGFMEYITTPLVDIVMGDKDGEWKYEYDAANAVTDITEKFADKEKMKEQYDMIEYPKYFLDKQYDYLICNIGKSFDAKGDKVMTHGGITVDEVIVPFIKIKAVDNNG